MDPVETAAGYDAIASWWLDQMGGSGYGVPALERALSFLRQGGHALDVGCGCEVRFIRILLERGFACTGLDNSAGMISLARARLPHAEFIHGDICSWALPRRYDLITAWDSTFHLPLRLQEPVLLKLCAGLAPQGVLLFSCGGGEKPDETKGEFGRQRFGYSTLGVPRFVRLLWRGGCTLRHLEYDQYPESHVVVIAQTTGLGGKE